MAELMDIRNDLDKQSGSTMIEILISIIVFSIGLLGVATSQTYGLTNAQSSMNKTYALQYANELIDVMRANQRISTSRNSTLNLFSNFATVSGNGQGQRVVNNQYANLNTPCNNASSSRSTGCTPTLLAQLELENWRQKIMRLPDGQGQVGFRDPNNLNDDVYRIVITWVDVKAEEERLGKATDTVTTNVAGETMQFATGPNGTGAFYRFVMDFEL
ncbi:MAG: type IV pilus modification protein PilV [Reinekea sp.]|jgi:type IV pilus assembly protein PilV